MYNMPLCQQHVPADTRGRVIQAISSASQVCARADYFSFASSLCFCAVLQWLLVFSWFVATSCVSTVLLFLFLQDERINVAASPSSWLTVMASTTGTCDAVYGVVVYDPCTHGESRLHTGRSRACTWAAMPLGAA